MGRNIKVRLINSGVYMPEMPDLTKDIFSQIKVDFSKDELKRIELVKKNKMEKKLKKCRAIS